MAVRFQGGKAVPAAPAAYSRMLAKEKAVQTAISKALVELEKARQALSEMTGSPDASSVTDQGQVRELMGLLRENVRTVQQSASEASRIVRK